jgi:hypothetical protein
MQEPTPLAATQHLTTRHATLIASRIVVAYLLFWVVVDLIELPREIHSVVNYAREGTAVGFSLLGAFHQSYLLRTNVLYLVANVLRITLWLMIAGWFYRCGPRIQNFLLPTSEPTTEP